MERDFEKFRGGPTPATVERLHITINNKGVIIFNKNLFRLLGKPEAVYLHFSRVRDIIALEPSSPRLPESFPVKQTAASWKISAAPFCRHFGIKIDTTLKFIRPDINSDGHLHLKLSETVNVGGSRRKRKIAN